LFISHDNVSDLLGIPSKPFAQMYENKVSDIMRTFHEYISEVQAAGAGAGAGAGSRKNMIQMDPDGFPIAPTPSSWDKFTKVDLEQLYRSYITHQYRKLNNVLRNAVES
jgi:hypothetical protein